MGTSATVRLIEGVRLIQVSLYISRFRNVFKRGYLWMADGGWLGCVADARDYFSRATFLAGFFYYIFYFQTPDETRSTISQRENTGSVKTCELATI